MFIISAGMKKNSFLPCCDLLANCSNNDNSSNYCTKDENDNNFNLIFDAAIKSECVQLEDYFPLIINENEKNVVCEKEKIESKGEKTVDIFKNEEILSSIFNKDTDIPCSKRRQTFKCSYCPKIFSNSSAIAKHKLTHSDQRKYTCDTCGKAFKRQDHLNGHKHTHKANKPHACHLCDRSYSDARSLRRHYENQHQEEYLRCREQRFGLESGCSSVDESGSVDIFGILDDAKCIKCDVCAKGFKNQSALNGHMRLHGGYGQTTNCITGPGEIKYNSQNNADIPLKICQNFDTPSSKFSNIVILTSKPTDTKHSQLHALLTMVPSTKRVSQCRNIREHESLPCNDTQQAFDRCISAITSSTMDHNNLQNISMDDLCMCLSPSSNNNVYPSGVFVETSNPSSLNSNLSQTINSTVNTSIIQQPTFQSHYSPITPSYSNHSNSTVLNQSHVFNYSSVSDNNNTSFESTSLEKYNCSWDHIQNPYISNNKNVALKPWSYCDFPLTISDITDIKGSNTSSLPHISSSNNLQDLILNFDCIDANLDNMWCKITESNDEKNNNNNDNNNDNINNNYNNTVGLSETESTKKGKGLETAIVTDSSPVTNSFLSENQSTSCHKQSLIQDSPMIAQQKKSKSRPAPIFIPPQTSAFMSRLRSPRVWNTSDKKEIKIPPYTPPPMLSPQRKGSGLFNSVWQWSNKTSGNLSSSICCPWNITTSICTITAQSNKTCTTSVVTSSTLGNDQISSVSTYVPDNKEQDVPLVLDPFCNSSPTLKKNIEPEHFLYQDENVEYPLLTLEDSDGLPTSATPRINIGPQYQVELPQFNTDKCRLKDENHIYEILLWDPRVFKDTAENISSLDLLMKIASSPAVKSCGLNMEYTFHLLCSFKGDIEKTLQTLLEDSFVVYDYVYSETTTWTTNEINKFQERLKKHDRDFLKVSVDLKSYGMDKSVKACVEFYYVWKQMNNIKHINKYRMKTSRRKLIDNNNHSSRNPNNHTSKIHDDSGYNLRKKFPLGNQKLLIPFNSYEYKTSSNGSSHDTSPGYRKLPKNPRTLHCSLCKKKFVRLKTLEKHLLSHKNPDVIQEGILLR